MTKLNMVHVNQLGEGADKYNGDCGGANCNGIMKTFGVGLDISVDESYTEIAGTERYSYLSELKTYLEGFGISSVVKGGMTTSLLTRTLARLQPFIALVRHGELENREIQSNYGNHFIYMEENTSNGYYIHDPYQRTNNLLYAPTSQFIKAWEEAEGAYRSGLLILNSLDAFQPTLQTPARAKITYASMNVRVDTKISSDTLWKSENYSEYKFGYEFDVVPNLRINDDGHYWRQIIEDGKELNLYIAEETVSGYKYMEIDEPEIIQPPQSTCCQDLVNMKKEIQDIINSY